jgi:hypothetical protein
VFSALLALAIVIDTSGAKFKFGNKDHTLNIHHFFVVIYSHFNGATSVLCTKGLE